MKVRWVGVLTGIWLCTGCASAKPASTSPAVAAPEAEALNASCLDRVGSPPTHVIPMNVHVRVGVPSSDGATRIFHATMVQELLPFVTFPESVAVDFAFETDSAIRARAHQRNKAADARGLIPPSTSGPFDALITFNLLRDGDVDSLRVVYPSPIAALHERFVAAVRRADAAHAFPPVPDNLDVPQRIAVRIVAGEVPENDVRPLSVMRVTFRTLTRYPRALRTVAPVYPRKQKDQGRSGTVLTSFVIDSTGAVRAGSLRILRSSHPDFAAAVAGAVPGSTFHPGQSHGCRVSTLVIQPYEFSIGG